MNGQPVVAGVRVCGLTLVLALCSLAQSSSSPQTITPFQVPVQADDQTTGIPKFYVESRQVLVEATVWNPPNKNNTANTSLTHKESQEKHSNGGSAIPQFPKNWPTPARGLTVKDFQVFDNGVQQKINFMKETDFPTVDVTGQWWMYPDERGAWGTLLVYDQSFGGPGWHLGASFAPAVATYVIGYVPPFLKSGECRTVQVAVQGHDVDLNRTQYCGLQDTNESHAASEATGLETQMQGFVNSTARQSIRVSMQAFAFRSSGVLHLISEVPSSGEGSVLPATNFQYVVEVHDAKAPATVQIAIAFDPPVRYWYTSDCRKKNLALHVLGMVYKANGEPAGQFADTDPCGKPLFLESSLWKHVNHVSVLDKGLIPTRFYTQVELAPGDYDLRVVVSDGKNFGRAQEHLAVQPVNADQLSMSDIAFAEVTRDASWVMREAAEISPLAVVPTPLVTKNVQFFQAVDTHLQKGSPLSLYLEIYEPLLERQTTAVSFRLRITDVTTGALVMNTEPMSAADWMVPGNAVIPIGLELATGKLTKGLYRIEVQASDSAGRESEWRTAKFNIQ